MHHSVTEMCTQVHISVTKWCIVGDGPSALWDLGDGSIVSAWEKIDCKLDRVDRMTCVPPIVIIVCEEKEKSNLTHRDLNDSANIEQTIIPYGFP